MNEDQQCRTESESVARSRTLFCPKCGDPLTELPDGTWQCDRGQMQLTRSLSRAFHECFVTEERQPAEPDLTQTRYPGGIGGVWFCPGCGVQAREDTPWDLRCPQCSRSLLSFVYPLIERHFHLDATPNTNATGNA